MTAFRMAMGSKASFSGLADVGKNAQLASLNTDPIQQRLLEANMRAAAGIEGIRADMRAAAPAPIPRGDF
jgi:hypothetical protein